MDETASAKLIVESTISCIPSALTLNNQLVYKNDSHGRNS